MTKLIVNDPRMFPVIRARMAREEEERNDPTGRRFAQLEIAPVKAAPPAPDEDDATARRFRLLEI